MLAGALLDVADLTEAWLNNADLRWARLALAQLAGADLSGADLSEANLEGAVLLAARLDGADLSKTQLTRTNLMGVDLLNVRGLTWAQVREARNVNLARLPANVRLEATLEASMTPIPSDESDEVHPSDADGPRSDS